MTPLLPAFETLRHLEPRRLSGRVTGMRGGALMVEGLRLPVGSTVRVEPQSQAAVPATGEVVGFEGGRAVIFTLEGGSGIAPGDRVEGAFAPATALVGDSLVGRVLDGLGRPLDGGAAPQGETRVWQWWLFCLNRSHQPLTQQRVCHSSLKRVGWKGGLAIPAEGSLKVHWREPVLRSV